jgi:hypothetical protein
MKNVKSRTRMHLNDEHLEGYMWIAATEIKPDTEKQCRISHYWLISIKTITEQCVNTAMPWLRWLVTGLLRQRSRLVPRQCRWNLWSAKWQWDKLFSEFFSLPCQYHSTLPLHTRISSVRWTRGTLVATLQRQSLSPHQHKQCVNTCNGQKVTFLIYWHKFQWAVLCYNIVGTELKKGDCRPMSKKVVNSCIIPWCHKMV